MKLYQARAGGCHNASPMEVTTAFTRKLSEHTKIPLLIAGNLEKGGNGMIPGGTQLGSPMGVVATGEVEMAEKLGTVCAREGRAIGANWAFAPVIDIDYNWHNPITNTRTFSSNPERVAAMGAAYVKSLQANGVAASIKHFPGDGRDERDQHLCTSVNDMSCEDWMATYGAVYKSCIQAGALTCMAGQIMQPAWSRRLTPGIRDEDIRPASQSKELLNGLLRGEGFTVTMYQPDPVLEGFTRTMKSYQENYDLCLYAANMSTKSNQTVVRLEWAQPWEQTAPTLSPASPPYLSLWKIPTTWQTSPAFVPLSTPTPPTTNPWRSPFRGVSPSDPFCGLWDAHL